jgi:hypothetical protein
MVRQRRQGHFIRHSHLSSLAFASVLKCMFLLDTNPHRRHRVRVESTERAVACPAMRLICDLITLDLANALIMVSVCRRLNVSDSDAETAL